MDEYDEYGNYLGEVVESESDKEDDDVKVQQQHEEDDEDGNLRTTSIVLHEDKAIYPSADFGDDVEIVMNEGPIQSKSVPLLPREDILKQVKPKLNIEETAQDKFDSLLYSTSSLIRTISFVGHLHSGKSSLVSLLHKKPGCNDKTIEKTCNVRKDERALKVSVKLRPISSSCSDFTGKNYWIQSIDTPGHVNFLDEMECALQISDGAVLVVDVVEGVQVGTELVCEALKRNQLVEHTIICLSKVDRLIHELKLPPADAYRKIHCVIEDIENLLQIKIDPKLLLFASAEHGWCFSLKSMAHLAGRQGAKQQQNINTEEDVEKLAGMLWGNIYYDSNKRSFSKSRKDASHKRSFEYFCLDPIYKIYSHVLGGEPSNLSDMLQGLTLSKKEISLDALPLLKTVLKKVLPSAINCLVESIVHNVPSPSESKSLQNNWTGSGKIDNPDNDILLHCVKLIDPHDDEENDVLDVEEESSLAFGNDTTFRALCRVYSGSLKVDSEVLVLEPPKLEEKREIEEDDDVPKAIVKSIRIPSQGGGVPCRKIQVATSGMLVLLTGVDFAISKSATLVNSKYIPPFVSLKLSNATKPTVKLAIEPLIPAELPKVLTGLRAIQRSYPSCYVNVEESGEHVIFGSGELHLDSIMRDLRERYSKGTEIKVCDPFVALCETVTTTSSMRSIGATSNDKNRFTLIASPVEEKILADIDAHLFPQNDESSMRKLLKSKYGYDILASRSVWAFGPNQMGGTNMFVDDTILEEKETNLYPCKDSVVQGFRWACREGPLCDEPLRGVKFKLLDAQIAGVSAHRGPGQLIPTIRRLCHSTILQSTPSLYEPYYKFDCVVTDARALSLVKKSLQSRRGGGGFLGDVSVVPGTTLQRIKGFVPVLDSFGLETEIRLRSRGTAFCQMYFNGWRLVEGDPLNDSIVLKPLEPSPKEFLARDLVLKTRRRKGLPDSIETTSFIDQQLLKELVKG